MSEKSNLLQYTYPVILHIIGQTSIESYYKSMMSRRFVKIKNPEFNVSSRKYNVIFETYFHGIANYYCRDFFKNTGSNKYMLSINIPTNTYV